VDKGVPELVKACEEDKVSVSLGSNIAEFTPEKQKEIMKDIDSGKHPLYATRIHTRRELEKKKKPLPASQFDVIYMDPPWQYQSPVFSTYKKSVDQQYPTMTEEEIIDLKIPAADNAVLFLWVIHTKERFSHDLIEKWGFEYKSQLIWDKDNFGVGYWFRGQHEILMVATKGKVNPPEESVRIRSIYREKSGKHSAKPMYFYDLIESYFPNGKYLEMFARSKRDNWTSWGLESV
jgi:N6-adenosine-specific RNA methylase IME4